MCYLIEAVCGVCDQVLLVPGEQRTAGAGVSAVSDAKSYACVWLVHLHVASPAL